MSTHSQVGSTGMFAAEDNENHFLHVTAIDPPKA
jgi:hypothetical protein